MNGFKYICLFTFVVCSFGCAREDESYKKYIGVWSNLQPNGLGDLRFTISRDGNGLLVNESLISNGATIHLNTAKIVNGYLKIDGGGGITDMVYSEADDKLNPINTPMFIPGFHREK